MSDERGFGIEDGDGLNEPECNVYSPWITWAKARLDILSRIVEARNKEVKDQSQQLAIKTKIIEGFEARLQERQSVEVYKLGSRVTVPNLGANSPIASIDTILMRGSGIEYEIYYWFNGLRYTTRVHHDEVELIDDDMLPHPSGALGGYL